MVAACLALWLAAAPTSWQEVAAGAEHLSLQEGGVPVEMIRFDLARYRPEVVVLGPDGARTASALRRETGAVAAINGGFFDPQWRPLGLRVVAGKTIIGLRPRVDWGVLLVSDGRAQIVHSRDFRPGSGVETAIQVGPRLLVEGEPLKLKPQSARRTAVAIDRDGQFLTLVVTRRAVEARWLAELLGRLGFHAAMMLDGGPSSQLSAAAGKLRLELPGGYAVPDALIVRPR